MIKVLVVEDDPMVGKLHEHYLTQIKGFQLCDIVRNSDEALKIMQTKEYNLVILDIFMPGMDGLQLLAKIREQEYDVDVIIVSAANDKDKIKAALRLGAFDYIIKPFEFERFNLALNNYKSRYNLVEEQSILKQDMYLDIDVTKQEDVMYGQCVVTSDFPTAKPEMNHALSLVRVKIPPSCRCKLH